jgi:hypothetical protein
VSWLQFDSDRIEKFLFIQLVSRYRLRMPWWHTLLPGIFWCNVHYQS